MRIRIFLLLAVLPAMVAFAAPWYPVPVLADGKPLQYTPLDGASKPWRVCALLPHGQDRFWWGVSWGLSEEAKRLNIKLGIYEAGGYEHLDVQRRQFAQCRKLRADAILVAGTTATGLRQEIEDAVKDHVVVIDLINGIDSASVTARAVGDTAELSAMAARYILTHAEHLPVTVLWFPGPRQADWVANAEKGLRSVLTPAVANVIDGGYDVPEPSRQMTLIRAMFHVHRPDFVLANSVAAVSAARIIATDKNSRVRVVSWYANQPVVELIEAGKVEAAPSNNPALQARIGLDLAIRALEGKKHPFDVKVRPEMLDRLTLKRFQTEKLFAPPGTWMVLQPLPD